MRSFNRVLAVTAGGGVVAGACAGGANTTSGHGVAAESSDYNVIRMYAVYTRGDEGSSIEFHPFDDGGLDQASFEIPDLRDERVNRYLMMHHRRRPGPGLVDPSMRWLRPKRSEGEDPPRRTGTHAVQIGQIVLMNEPEQGMAAPGSVHLFEVELGWQIASEEEGDGGGARPTDHIPAPGSLFALGLGGLLARRRRS